MIAFLASTIALLGAPASANSVMMSDHVHGCTVQTKHYRLVVDVRGAPMVRVTRASDGAKADLRDIWLRDTDAPWLASASGVEPHFHPLRSGPYLAEVHIEGIVLGEWDGLVEVSLYCHEDRVHVVASFICPDGEWVNRGSHVYRAPEGHRDCEDISPGDFGMAWDASGHVGSVRTLGTSPSGPMYPRNVVRQWPERMRLLAAVPDHVPWTAGSVHEVGCAILMDRDGTTELPDGAVDMEMGEFLGYDPATGLYRIKAQTSGTPEPPRGLIAGARYSIRNDGTPRRILIDQKDPWGGISGGIIRDGTGRPLPISVQFGLNFPEHHVDGGEPGWATLTYPLELGANEEREIHAEHLYHGLADRELTYLTSLENVGAPLLLQTTVGRGESHTLTTGMYPQALTPGNELRVNDFRRIYTEIVSRSVSAILPTFFGYYDTDNAYQGLVPGFVRFRETGPFLTEYTVEAATAGGEVTGELRVWQAAHSDMTRIFTEVDLQVQRDIDLSDDAEAPLFFLRHHAFNPMAFTEYAYSSTDGLVMTGELTYERTVVENGTPLDDLPFVCIYNADNPLDDGILTSDITGNSGFVLLDWDVAVDGEEVKPGFYAFCTGAEDPDGAYARDVAVVPTEPIRSLPAGSHIRYRALQVVYGDAGYQGIAKRSEMAGTKAVFKVAMRPGKRRVLPDTQEGRLQDLIEAAKAHGRAKVEHPFRVI